MGVMMPCDLELVKGVSERRKEGRKVSWVMIPCDLELVKGVLAYERAGHERIRGASSDRYRSL